MSQIVQPHEQRWVWRQIWRDVLFLHWRVDEADLRPHVPSALAIDNWLGEAWVSLVLFRLQVAPIWLPWVPGLSSLVEANLRTYVSLGELPGIYFLSIHADNRWALALARLMTPLPYQWARFRYTAGREKFACELQGGVKPHNQLSLNAAALSSPRHCNEGTQEAWLLERYRAFAPNTRSELQTATVAHNRWSIQPARVELRANTLGHPFGLNLDRPPDDAQFSREMQARFSRFEPCSDHHRAQYDDASLVSEAILGPG